MIKKALLLCLAFSLVGCNPTSNGDKAESTVYFSVAELLSEQIGLLISLEAQLEKRVISGETTELLELEPKDSAAWKSQLQLFFDADISRPGYAGDYDIEQLPAIGNISKTTYTALKKKNFVRVMECSFEGELLKEIRLELSKKNEVFQLNQELFLFFNTETGVSRLSSFSITGDEDMQLKSPLDFDVKATVVLP